MQISTIGVDLAKHVFQVHGVYGQGKIVLVRQLRRADDGVVEASLLSRWHGAKRDGPLLGPRADAADAAAICKAVTRPSMRFFPIKTAEQQAALTVHRTRDLLIGQ
jgi:transposase